LKNEKTAFEVIYRNRKGERIRNNEGKNHISKNENGFISSENIKSLFSMYCMCMYGEISRGGISSPRSGFLISFALYFHILFILCPSLRCVIFCFYLHCIFYFSFFILLCSLFGFIYYFISFAFYLLQEAPMLCARKANISAIVAVSPLGVEQSAVMSRRGFYNTQKGRERG
jgi:hypothetical protein